MEDQERLWRETTADDNSAIEQEILRGGQVATDINPKMYYDIQVILSRLVAKAEQLIDNVTTNLAESWMHVRSKFDGGKVINRSQSKVGHGSTVVWGLVYNTIWVRNGDPHFGNK